MSNFYQEYKAKKYGNELTELQYTIPINTFDPEYCLNGKSATLKLYEKNLIELWPNRVGCIDQGVKYPGDVNKISQFILVPRIETNSDFKTPYLIVCEPDIVYIYETTGDVRFTGGLCYYFSVARPDNLTDDNLKTVTGIELSASAPDRLLDVVKWHYDIKPII